MKILDHAPYFTNKEQLKAFLKVEGNKATLDAIKKSTMKHADCVGFRHLSVDKDGSLKALANNNIPKNPDVVLAAINTTNIMDSHYDVHYPGLWKKSLSENKMIMHLQEHNMAFEKIISSQGNGTLKAYTQMMTWKELGFNYKGSTEVLLFESTLKKGNEDPRNKFMYEQYAKRYVENHSVGMQYVKMVLCVNEPDEEYYGAEFEAWEKYFPDVVNQEFAEEKGFFWLIKEAKCIEGSAVPIGSNRATPTLEPGKSEQEEMEEKESEFAYYTKNLRIA